MKYLWLHTEEVLKSGFAKGGKSKQDTKELEFFCKVYIYFNPGHGADSYQ